MNISVIRWMYHDPADVMQGKMCPDGALWAVGCADAYENLSKKRKTFQKKKNVTSGTKIYPILKEIVWKFCYIAGTVLGRIINIFCGGIVSWYI